MIPWRRSSAICVVSNHGPMPRHRIFQAARRTSEIKHLANFFQTQLCDSAVQTRPDAGETPCDRDLTAWDRARRALPRAVHVGRQHGAGSV